MSLALVLLEQGKIIEARRTARLAVVALAGPDQGRARMQLALIEQRSGALEEALKSYAEAVVELRRAGDTLAEARLLNNRGILQAYRGQAEAAARDLVQSERLLIDLGQEVAAADAHWNLGFAAGLRGDAVMALKCFDSAGSRLLAAGVERGAHAIDQCQVLLSVGLVAEAQEAIEAGIRALTSRDVGSDLAEAQLLLSETLLAAGDSEGARTAATGALSAFDAQGRGQLSVLARYALLRAAAEEPGDPAWASAATTAAALRAAGWWVAAVDVDLLIARHALARGQGVDPVLVAAARRAATSGPPGQRLRAWHTVALHRQSQGDRRGAAVALLAGLRVHDDNLGALGATELQVHTAARAQGLADAGLALAFRGGRPARVFAWSERWRARSLAVRPSALSLDPIAIADLDRLRAVTAELEALRFAGDDVAELQRRQHLLERAVTHRARLKQGSAQAWSVPSVRQLHSELKGRALVEFVRVRDELAAVVFAGGRCSLHELGSASRAENEVVALRYALARRSHGGSGRAQAALTESISTALDRLSGQLLAPLARRVEDRPLVVVPTGELHVLPWGMLPFAEKRPVCVSPSASSWLASRERRVGPRGQAALVSGPGLPGARDEVAAIRLVYGEGTCDLTGDAATVGAVLGNLEGSSVAHLAAHGSFRTDNPLFSSLAMADGALTIHDLETLTKPPSLVVLSACDSGLSAIHAGNEIVGLAGALLRLGTRTLIGSVAPMPDVVARDIMVTFHTGIRAGLKPATALRNAQLANAGDGAGVFVCFGDG